MAQYAIYNKIYKLLSSHKPSLIRLKNFLKNNNIDKYYIVQFYIKYYIINPKEPEPDLIGTIEKTTPRKPRKTRKKPEITLVEEPIKPVKIPPRTPPKTRKKTKPNFFERQTDFFKKPIPYLNQAFYS